MTDFTALIDRLHTGKVVEKLGCEQLGIDDVRLSVTLILTSDEAKTLLRILAGERHVR